MQNTALPLFSSLSDFKFMLDVKGNTEVITSVVCLSICRNYFNTQRKYNARDQCNTALEFKVTALCFTKNEEAF